MCKPAFSWIICLEYGLPKATIHNISTLHAQLLMQLAKQQLLGQLKLIIVL